MKKQLLLALFFVFILSFQIKAQETHRKVEGIGIEVGVGYNFMKLHLELTDLDSTATLNNLWMQPSTRIHYDMMLKQIGKKNSLKLKTFLGYYTFGGKTLADAKGNRLILAFGSIEAGAGLTFDFLNRFQLTPLIKAQYIISGKQRHLLKDQSGVPTEDIRTDVQNLSANAGLQFRFKYRHFTLGAEAWIGLNDFYKKDGYSAKENNYRVLIGYEF